MCAVRGWVALYPPRGYSAHTGRIPGQHKNGEYAVVTCGRPAFQRHESRAEGSDPTPMLERRKSAVCRREQRVRRRRAPTLRNSLKASRRNILFLCRRWKIPLRQPLFPIGAETPCYGSFYHLRWRWPASHLSGLRRSRCPAKCTGRGMAPHPQAAGRSPDPLLATIGEKHEKRYQIQHAHGVR